MSLSRRQMLQGIAVTALATGANTSSAQSSLKPTASLPCPKSLGSPVTESLHPVIENSRHVHTHFDRIVEVAGWMAYEELPMPNLGVPFGLEKTPDVAMDFVMVANTIDTAFTDFKSTSSSRLTTRANTPPTPRPCWCV